MALEKDSEKTSFIDKSIIRDMTEGVLIIGLDGIISSVNPAAESILGKNAENILGKSFATAFFEFKENDEFNQTVLDAVYDTSTIHENMVPYFTGNETKDLFVKTSYLHEDEKKVAVIAVITDVTELNELRDALKAMEEIRKLNGKLELRNKLLSETFGRFLSDDIVKQLLETPGGLALGGKKRNVTVMMSDLRGFTALSESMDAHDLLTMLNHYLGIMTEIIQQNRGTIIEFIGDGIMAVFGAPNENPNHADDAVAAGVMMEAAMKEVNEWNRSQGYPVLEMGIGINTGDVIIGNIGSEKRTKYGATGSEINICGRIESYTCGGQMLISENTKKLCKAKLTVEDEIRVKPKGLDGEISLFHITGVYEPYSVSCPCGYEKAVSVKNPFRVPLFELSGKHISDEMKYAEINAVSKDSAEFTSDLDLEKYENIQFDIGEKLLAKIIKKEGTSYTVRFTSRPLCFNEWLSNACSEN